MSTAKKTPRATKKQPAAPTAPDSQTFWGKTIEAFQETLQTSWQQAMASMNPVGAASPSAPSPISFDSAVLETLQKQYMQELSQLWLQSVHLAVQPGDAFPAFKDRRFGSEAWRENPVSAFAAASYLLHARALMGMADAMQADNKTKAQLRFAVQQWIDASAPSNFFALNPEAQKKAIATQGESIAKGVQNLVKDMMAGHLSQTDESVFEVGQNVATTEGAVVFENALFQLIEYKPLTDKVYERPLLLVPPCINKFYILDLQAANSFIRYAVSQGHRTYVLSWCNPDESMAHVTWDDYVEKAVIQAIEMVQEITGAKDGINALGFCVGGTLLCNALAVLAARGQKPVKSATFLTTLLDFTHTGVLDVFIDESFVKFREMQFAKGGLLPGRDLASTFSLLRPNDLVWNYVVGNYLKGETPPPFDLLYWNGDSTNLPGPMYAWYLRNTYLENRLVQPGQALVCGEKIDLRLLDLPTYIYGSREDHIVPIEGAYASTQHLPGKKRFVMGASGHIAGVINPPTANKRCYWSGPDKQFPSSAGEWLAQATEHAGSWWPDWAEWLKGHAGKLVRAPKAYGNPAHPAIEAAPGRYVKVPA